MNKTYTALHDLYFSLNPYTLTALKGHASYLTDDQMTLDNIITAFAKDPDNEKYVEGFQELKDNNSISAMEDYYELIEFMVDQIQEVDE